MGERVYLLRGRTVELGPGHVARYPAGYYQPSEFTAKWLKDGLAVRESEWEARHAAAEEAAAADPLMHPAGPKGDAPREPTEAPAGKMWPAGPKKAPRGSQKPAVGPKRAPKGKSVPKGSRKPGTGPEKAPQGSQRPVVESTPAPGKQPAGPAPPSAPPAAPASQDSAGVQTSATQDLSTNDQEE